jgi:hypothetical protein
VFFLGLDVGFDQRSGPVQVGNEDAQLQPAILARFEQSLGSVHLCLKIVRRRTCIRRATGSSAALRTGERLGLANACSLVIWSGRVRRPAMSSTRNIEMAAIEVVDGTAFGNRFVADQSNACHSQRFAL